jgi:hypothetical protein
MCCQDISQRRSDSESEVLAVSKEVGDRPESNGEVGRNAPSGSRGGFSLDKVED